MGDYPVFRPGIAPGQQGSEENPDYGEPKTAKHMMLERMMGSIRNNAKKQYGGQ